MHVMLRYATLCIQGYRYRDPKYYSMLYSFITLSYILLAVLRASAHVITAAQQVVSMLTLCYIALHVCMLCIYPIQ